MEEIEEDANGEKFLIGKVFHGRSEHSQAHKSVVTFI